VNDIIQGRSFEEAVMGNGGRGPFVVTGDEAARSILGRGGEFLSTKGVLALAKEAEGILGSDLAAAVGEAKALKVTNARELKTRILAEVVETRLPKFASPTFSADGLRVLLTEYLFRAAH
jgi:hypothetical protein